MKTKNLIMLEQILIIFCLSFGAIVLESYASTFNQTEVPQTLLPDGTVFKRWSDRTNYTRTYHVNQNNPLSSDNNEGTEEHPFKTINHAAQIVKPGERVFIHSGVYRELVRPLLSGEGDDRMISYEAAPGEKVIIRGSRIITTKWELSIDPNDSVNASRNQKLSLGLDSPIPRSIFSKQLWMTKLPDDMFENGYLPFQLPNCTNDEFDMMDWATRWKGRVPYTLPRGLVFQEGRRMAQVAAYEDLIRVPGSYWVGYNGKTIHIHPTGGANPNGKLFEAATQEHIIQPQSIGLGYIRVSGLIIEHCANSFLRSGVGALFTMGGHHWIIEKNTVRLINSLGIEMGSSAYEGRDPRNTVRQRPNPNTPRDPNAQRPDPNISGYNIVRQNNISGCGTAGIRGLGNPNALVEDNYIYNCGWQDAEFHWEVAGIKLLRSNGTVVMNNHIGHLQGSCGIWLDWGNVNSRVTGNVIYDISTAQGAIFVEASQVPNLVDNNVMWNINGQGVRLADTDNSIVTQNLFGHISEDLVVMRVATDRSMGGRKLTSKGNTVVNNLVVDQGKPVLSEDPSNLTDYNVYISTLPGQKAMKDNGKNSVSIYGDITFDEDNLILNWKVDSLLPIVPIQKNCEWDFFMLERTLKNNVPGPFLGLTNPVIIELQ